MKRHRVPPRGATRQRPAPAQAVESLIERALPRVPVPHPQAKRLPVYEVQA
jgi:hypothetical protein